MNIKKILKFYLVLTLTVTAFSLLSYNAVIKSAASSYYASVLHTLDGLIEGQNADSGSKYLESKSYVGLYLGGNFVSKLQNLEKLLISLPGVSDGLSFSISNNPAGAFALPGAKLAEIMKLNFTTKKQEATLNAVKFKIQATDPVKIERAYLMADKNLIASGVPVDGYLKFGGFDYKLAANSKSVLSVKLDLAADLQPGDRFRLDVEMPEDLVLSAGGANYQINAQYPIRGKYLSVNNRRLGTQQIAIPEAIKLQPVVTDQNN